MGAETKIQWTHFTFNPWIGCSHKPKHPGCAHCYAEADQDTRRGRVVWGTKGTRSKTSKQYWREPLKWNRDAQAAGERRRVFCASLADVFEDWQGPIVDAIGEKILVDRGGKEVTTTGGLLQDDRDMRMSDLRYDLFNLIDATPHLDWLLLTKRPENVFKMWPGLPYRKNVWIGTSISDQRTADQYLPELLELRSLVPVLFVSAEPLLAEITIANRFPLDGNFWFIVGGESGPHARPFNIQWARKLKAECGIAKIPFFMKQVGSHLTGPQPYKESRFKETIRIQRLTLKDSKGGDPSEWPEDLRVREFPVTS